MRFVNILSVALLLVSYVSCSDTKTIKPTGQINNTYDDRFENNTICSLREKSLGYPLCKNRNCNVVYVDEYGQWSEEEDKWCICKCNSGPKCSPKILNQGYRCCSANNCSVKYTDNDGEWGVDLEKKAWCGIRYSCKKNSSPKCSPKILDKGFRCCSADNCSIKSIDSDGEWGVDLEKKAWCGIRYSCQNKKN